MHVVAHTPLSSALEARRDVLGKAIQYAPPPPTLHAPTQQHLPGVKSDTDPFCPYPSVSGIFNCLLAHHRPLPEGITPEVAKQAIQFFASTCGTAHSANWPELTSPLMSTFISELRRSLEQAVNGNTGTRLALFAAHNTRRLSSFSLLFSPLTVSGLGMCRTWSSSCIKTPFPEGTSSA